MCPGTPGTQSWVLHNCWTQPLPIHTRGSPGPFSLPLPPASPREGRAREPLFVRFFWFSFSARKLFPSTPRPAVAAHRVSTHRDLPRAAARHQFHARIIHNGPFLAFPTWTGIPQAFTWQLWRRMQRLGVRCHPVSFRVRVSPGVSPSMAPCRSRTSRCSSACAGLCPPVPGCPCPSVPVPCPCVALSVRCWRVPAAPAPS